MMEGVTMQTSSDFTNNDTTYQSISSESLNETLYNSDFSPIICFAPIPIFYGYK